MPTLPTQEQIKKVVYYNPDNGIFTRKIKTAQCNKAGDVAGGVSAISGYHQISLYGKIHRSHRIAWVYIYGSIPESKEIDHIDGNRNNNSIDNLRIVTSRQNSLNSSKSKNNTSGTTGVTWDKFNNKWTAQICVNYKVIRLGRYKNKEEAIIVRKMAEIEHGFHENHGKNKCQE